MPHTKETQHVHDRIGFIGLGNMGALMASNLADWLHATHRPPLMLWNRTASKLPPASDKIVHAKSIKEMANLDIILTSLSSDEAVKDIYQQLLDGVREKEKAREGHGAHEKGTHKSTIFVETSTVYPDTSGELEREASAIPHTYFLQCPVFGPPPLAKTAQLVWVLSGDHYAKTRVREFLVPSMGRKFIDVGSSPERASAFKLNGNFLILGIIENLAEAMTLASKTGVGAELLMEFVKEFIPAPSFIGYGTKITTNNFAGDAGFTVTGGLKDANHIRHLAASVDATIPIIDIAHRNLITSRANGGADLDWSSLCAGPRLAAGLQPFTGLKAQSHDNGFGAKEEEALVSDAPDKIGGIKQVQNFK